MGHDATKILMGTSQSSDRPGIEAFGSDPASFPAGLAVRRKDDNTLSVTLAHGNWVGISLGRSLSDHKKTAVQAAGLRVPVLLELAPARGEVTITSYANLVSGTDDTLKVGATTFTFQAGAATPGDATVQAATDNATTAASLVTQINAHAVAGAAYVASRVGAVVTITAKNNALEGADIDLIYTDNDTNVGLTVDDVTFTGGGVANADWINKGDKVYFSDTTGKADDPNSAATVSDAVYMSGVMTGIDEDGNEAAVALVDFPAGL